MGMTTPVDNHPNTTRPGFLPKVPINQMNREVDFTV